MRGLKRDLTEGGIRVPTMARWPGVLPAGLVVDRALGFADFLPTFADLAGMTPPTSRPLDGLSFAPLLRGAPFDPPLRKTMYWEFHEPGFSQAVLMDERWKAIRMRNEKAPIAIYDLSTDPGEEKNLATARRVLVTRAGELFESERREVPEWPTIGK